MLHLHSVQPTPTLEYYVDLTIPPPMHACVAADLTIDNILFSEHHFKYSGKTNSRYKSSQECDSLIVEAEAEDISILNTHVRYLTTLHASKTHAVVCPPDDDIEEVCENESEDVEYVPAGIPHHFVKEQMFVDHFSKCSSEVYRALTFQGDMMKHLYPHCRVEDIYMHLPLIGRNETTNEGMILTNAYQTESMMSEQTSSVGESSCMEMLCP